MARIVSDKCDVCIVQEDVEHFILNVVNMSYKEILHLRECMNWDRNGIWKEF